MPYGGMYDAIVIGGGPAGLAGGLWLARYRRKVRIFDTEDPRNAVTWGVHGYLGLQDPPPAELRRIGKLQAVDAGAEYERCTVVSITGGKDEWMLETEDGRTFGARRILMATGLRDIKPEIEGLDDFYGSSIWHCPDCDGLSAADKNVGVIGWGRQIAAFCMYMLTWTDKLTILTDGHPAEIEDAAKRALERWNIPVREDVIERLEGKDGIVEQVVFADGSTQQFEAMFFHIASGPGSTFPADLGCQADEDGILEVDRDFETTVPGLYAAGDITPGSRLAMRAAADGIRAALGIHKSLIPDDRRLK
ncbi:thioredoxin reductase [Longimicrobium terrae]|uniref:Thioredoxin reductase n=2 Tax=Longimicrobium terrae TaxID=1639882 RepID=A0A841H371_9BACT|nr:NAD(P)/FAD-dependent oxidoreductase [Longimicrobium terrae]MBB4638297.1 thioredoxin reductase [Longimicrobium terrae]MBB6072635.1 thioredoxin reductase [Longimicrobium terrae]